MSTTAICTALVLVCSVASAQQPFDIRWANEKLTVKASAAPLAALVGEVAKLASVEVIGLDKLNGSVSVDITDMELRKALTAILEGVNYSIQERSTRESTSPVLVLRIASMARAGGEAVRITGPLQSPALDALVAEAIADHDDQVESDADDDPDYYDDIRKDRLEASRLASEGAFGPKVELAALIKMMEHYNDEIRVEALKALGTRGIEDVLVPLINAVGDDHWTVRNTAVEILGRTLDPHSLERVGQMLIQGDEREVKVDALRILAARAQPESAAFLRAYLNTPPGADDALLRAAAQQMINEFEWRAQHARDEHLPDA